MKVHLKNKRVPGVTRCGRSNAKSRTTWRPEDVTCNNCKRTFKPIVDAEYEEDSNDFPWVPETYEKGTSRIVETVGGPGPMSKEELQAYWDKHGPITPKTKAVYELDLPPERPGITVKFNVQNYGGYVTISDHEGRPAEMFVCIAKEGSTLSGFVDALAIAISIGLRAGVDPALYVEKLSGLNFVPQGYARLGNQEEAVQVTSIVDALMKILVAKYPDLNPQQPEET